MSSMSPNQNRPSMFGNLKSDLLASLIAFLVVVPLCLGIAWALGAPKFSVVVVGGIGGTAWFLDWKTPWC